MAKIMIRRGEAVVEFENEKAWKKEDGDIRLFTQDDFNALDATLSSKYEAKGGEFKTRAERAEGELTTLRQEIATKKETELNSLKTKIEEGKKGLSPRDLKTLEMLAEVSVEKAYAWLTDPAIAKEGKKKSPITPEGKGEDESKPAERRRETII
jgi:hypothetical protein